MRCSGTTAALLSSLKKKHVNAGKLSESELRNICKIYKKVIKGKKVAGAAPREFSKQALVGIAETRKVSVAKSWTRQRIWDRLNSDSPKKVTKKVTKTAPKKSTAKKSTAKKSTAKKSTAKKSTAKTASKEKSKKKSKKKPSTPRDKAIIAEYEQLKKQIEQFLSKRDTLKEELLKCDPQGLEKAQKKLQAKPKAKTKKMPKAQLTQELKTFVDRFHVDDLSDEAYDDLINDIAVFFLDHFDDTATMQKSLFSLVSKMLNNPADKPFIPDLLKNVEGLVDQMSRDRANYGFSQMGVKDKAQKIEAELARRRQENEKAKAKGQKLPYPEEEDDNAEAIEE